MATLSTDIDEIVPFEYQKETFANFKKWYDGDKNEALISYATGLGKTVAAYLCVRHIISDRGGKVLWVTHLDSLVRQTGAFFRKFSDFPVGLEKERLKSSPEDRLVIGSLMTLKDERLAGFAERFTPDLIVFDEAHHSAVPTWLSIKMAFPNAKVLNLTATPYRSDLSQIMDLGEVIGAINIEEGVELGRLVPANTVGTLNLDLGGVRISKDDWEAKSLGKLMMEPPIVDKCLELIEKNIGDRKAIVFAASVEHGRLIAKKLREKFTVCEIYGDTSGDEREALYRKARESKTQILVNNLVLTEGFDLPEISMVAILRPTKNPGLFIQMMGRGLRTCEGKRDCLVIDAIDAKKEINVSHGLKLPNEDDIKKASAIAGRKLSPAEVLISWFKKRDEVEAYIRSGIRPTSLLKAPEDVLAAVFSGRDMSSANPVQKELLLSLKRAMYDVETPIPEAYDKLAMCIKSPHVESLAKFLLKGGWSYYPRGMMPKTLAEDERNAKLVSAAPASRLRGIGVSIIASIEPRLKNFITEIGHSKSLRRQAQNYYKLHNTFGKSLVWSRPVGIENPNFAYIEIPAKLGNFKYPVKSFFVRDDAEGTVRRYTFFGNKLQSVRPVNFGEQIFPLLPEYCKSSRWTSSSASDVQLQYVSEALKVKLEDVKALNLSRMSASCLLSSCYSKAQLSAIGNSLSIDSHKVGISR